MTQYSGVYSLTTQGQALTSGQWATDPYYKNTTLLLHADGKANGSQNNTFLDSSTNNFTITRNGNTTQGSFTPYGTTWSNYFNAANLGTQYATQTDIASGSFTIEFWVNAPPQAGPSVRAVAYFNGSPSTTSDVGWDFVFSQTGAIVFEFNSGATNVITLASATTALNNTWNHVAVTRNGAVFTLWLNGVSQGAAASAATCNGSTSWYTYVGSRAATNTSDCNNLYVSNFRIVKGTAVYTSNFTPSTTPLTAISGTGLLTCQSNRFLDNSATPLNVGVTAATVQKFSPFPPQYQYTPAVIGGSNYADGSGANYLTAPINSSLALGSNSFTLEGWIYLTQFNTYNFIYNRASGSTNATTEIELNINSSGTLNCSVYVGSTQYSVGAATGAIKLNQWQHIAFVRNGTSGQIYINGVASGSAVTITGSLNDTSSVPNIRYQAPSANRGMTGYLADFRLVNGTAVYTGTFTPPTGPFSASMGANPFGGSNTSAATATLLLNATNAGIYDNAMMNNLETVGNAQVSTSVVKYGSGSLAFDGSGDYLQAPHTTVAEFGSGNFTVEFWAYINAQSGAYTGVVGQWVAGASNAANSWNVSTNLYNTTNKLGFSYSDGSATTDVAFGSALTTGTWSHYAICRSGNLLYAFKDGVLLNTGGTSITATINNGTSVLRVGSVGTTGGGSDFNGYLDDLRITKGVARYTGNFIPPKVAFANQ